MGEFVFVYVLVFLSVGGSMMTTQFGRSGSGSRQRSGSFDIGISESRRDYFESNANTGFDRSN